MQAGEAPATPPYWADLLDDRLLGQVFLQAGKDQRQCQAVCCRWRRIWFSEPGLWRTLHISPIGNVSTQLAVVQRVAPLVERLEVKGAADFEKELQQQGEAQWSLPAVLACFPAGRRQRLRKVRLSADLARLMPAPHFLSWTLADHQPLSAATLRKLGRLRGLQALELDSWQLPHCSVEVLSRLTQLSRLRLRARELPEGYLPGVINERLTQLRSLVLETSLACSPVGISQLTALSALTRLEVRESNPLDNVLLVPDLARLPHLSAMRFQSERGVVRLPAGHEVGDIQLLRRDQRAALAVYHYNMLDANPQPPQPSLAALLNSLVPPGAIAGPPPGRGGRRRRRRRPNAAAGCAHKQAKHLGAPLSPLTTPRRRLFSKMTDAREALALEKRDKAFTNRSKIGCITKADAQLAIARLQGGLHELAASSLRRRRGTAIRARGQPEAQPLGGPARELPESVLKQLEVHLVKSDSGELEPALFRRVTVKKEPALRRWVPIDDMVKLVDTEYTFNAGKKAGINTLESRLRHLTATKIYSADGKVLNTVHGVVGVPREVIELTLQQCPVHADRRPQQHAAKPRLVPIVVNRAFWQCQLDLIDLGEGRDDGFRYVLVYIDLLTRHVWLRALATKEPISVAREVNGIWMETQVPAVLQSDNGVEFCADIMEALCSEYGVQHITSSIGHPQSQGATERCNREIKDYIRSLLMQAPAISWGYQVRHVQRMVNDAPTTALGGMTRSESLFGAPSMTAKLPSAETIIKLLGFTNSTEAVNPNGGIPTRAPAAAPRKPKSGWASRRSRSKAAAGRKRAAAELSEDEDAAAVSDEEASPAQEGQQQQQQQQQQDRSGLRRSAAVHRAWLADLSDDDAEAGVARTLPPRAAAESSPAGLRRQRRRLTQGSDALARLADVAMAADGEAPAVAGEAQQAAGPAAAAGEAQQAANAAAAAAAAGEAQQAVGPAGEAQQAAGAAGEPAFQLPEHLQKARAATMAAQQKRAERVQNSRQGPPRAAFSVGDSVMLWVKAQGRVGRSVDRKRLPCRVVAVRHSFGKQIRYTLRCNAGVLKGTYADGVEPATAADAASLTFRGTASSGPGIKVNITPQQGVKQHAQIAVITV